MIELDSLKFTVDTSDLVTAVTKVQALQTAVSNLNKPLAESAKISAKVAAENAKVAVAEEKVAQAKNKTTESQARVDAAQNRAAKAAERVTSATKQQTTVLEKNQSIYEFMLQGYSKGQATTLAAAKAQGALADELMQVGKVLQDQRKLMGGDPFDKSMQGLLSLKNALVDMDAENRMVNQGIQLTSKQYKELSRDLQRITETSIATGESFETMTVRLNNHKKQFVEVATEINKLTEVEKERERSQRLQANAIRAIATEDEKMESIMRSLNVAQSEHVTVSEKAARSIANYERNLRLAGLSGEVAATKLDKFRKSAMMAAQAEEKRKVDMLSRALAPQISDVVVSLGSGMNPMTVLLQQGLQVRDLIGLSGVAVNDLQKAFKSAASDMVSSLKGTAVALGSLLIGGLQDAGAAVISFGSKITGTSKVLDFMEKKLLDLTATNSLVDKSFRGLFGLFASGARIIAGFSAVVLPIAALIATGVALKNVIQEEDAFARALALSGGQMNISHASAVQYAKSLSAIHGTTGEYISVIGEMAKAGNLTAKEIEMVSKAAIDLQRYGGVAIEETVKSFSKMKEKPVEALIELAKRTGDVSPEVLNLVMNLTQQGRTAEATAVSMQTLASVNTSAVNQMKGDYSDFGLFLINLSREIKEFFSSVFKDLFYKADPAELAKKSLSEIQARIAEVKDNLKLANLFGIDTKDTLLKDLYAQENALQMQIAGLTRRNRAAEDFKAEQNTTNGLLEKALGLETAGVSKINQKKKAMEEVNKIYDKLIAKGLKTEADRKLAIAGVEEKYKESKPKKSEADKEKDKINKAYARDIERISDMQNKAKGVIEDLTDAEILLRDVRSSETWAKYGPDRQKKIESDLIELAGIQRQIKAEEELNDIRSKNDQTYRDYLSTIQTSIEGLADSNRSLEEEIELIGLEETAIHNVNKERLKALILKKRNEAMPSSAAEVILLEQELALMERQVELLDEKFAKQNFMQMRDSIADAIETGLFEGGKAGSQKLRDIIEAELRKPITVFIRAVVGDILGGEGVGGSNTKSSFNNLLSYGKKMYDMLTGGFSSSISGKVSTSLLNAGNWLATSSNSTLASIGKTLQSSASSLGKLAGSLGNIAAGYSLSKMIGNGYQTGAGNLVDIAGTIGSYFFGPIAGVVSGLVNRLFGRKYTGSGIEGTFKGSDVFAGNTVQYYKGGLFSSDKQVRTGLDKDSVSRLSDAYSAVSKGVEGMAKNLGLTTEALNGFRYSFSFNTNGMSAEQVQTKFLKELENVANKQAEYLLGSFETITSNVKSFFSTKTVTSTKWTPGAFVKYGETALEALTRLSNALSSVNIFLRNTNVSLMEMSLQGADTASKLVEMFGSVESFTSATGAYYEQFFTEQEKLTKAHELLSETFSSMNMTIPESVSAYRSLVESQDLTTESGREMFSSLISLSSAFYQIKEASEEASSTIIEEINRLRGVVSTSSTNGFEGTKASFLQAISLSQSGDAAARASLPGLSQSLEDMFLSNASSLEDVNRFRSWLANNLSSSIPAFASGGLHSGGVRLVGENGPELEMTGPSRIFSNNDTMQMLSSEGVIKAIEVMNSNLEMLRAEVRADVQHNAKTAKLLDRVIPDGDSIKTSAI